MKLPVHDTVFGGQDSTFAQDYGTSEGARKRKSGGGAKTTPSSGAAGGPRPGSKAHLISIASNPEHTKSWTPETFRMMGEAIKHASE